MEPRHDDSAPTQRTTRYGFVGMIVENRASHGMRINKILADHSHCIVGRLGLPNVDHSGLSIVTLIVHASTDELGSLTGKLGALPGVSIKSALYKATPKGV